MASENEYQCCLYRLGASQMLLSQFPPNTMLDHFFPKIATFLDARGYEYVII